MKIKDGFWLREIAGTNVAVPLGKAAREFSCVVNLNGSGALLFRLLQAGVSQEELIQALLENYDTDKAAATAAVDDYLRSLRDAGLLVQ